MRRLPFFTLQALGAAAATAVVVAVVLWLGQCAALSPGPLGAAGDGTRRGGVTSHAQLEASCARCHPAPWQGAMSARCLTCHDDVQAELAAGDGLHARLGAGAGCLACHTEHRGRDAALTRIDPERFPHDVTGFSLAAHRRTYAGAPFRCGDCHEGGHYAWDPARCAACHRDADPAFARGHVEAWGDDCRACHDGRDRFGAAFDHAATSFPLRGEHVDAGCVACHPGARRAADVAAAPGRCVGCHRDDDVHAGRLGDDCARCHEATGWQPATFDHATTRFALDGAHARVPCADCHARGRYEGTPRECVACHRAPADHRGVFGDDCAACHDTTRWEGARFDHRFPLDHGARRPVPCATCHPASYRAYTCYGCHEHTPAKIEREHREEGIRDYADCVRCHPTGREDEAERGGRGRGDDDD